MAEEKPLRPLLRMSKAAELLGVTHQTIRMWDKAGKIKVVRTVGGHRLVPIEEIERLRGAGK